MDESLLLQIKHIYYPLISAVGVPVNLVAIVILYRGKCGLSQCITSYLLGMAASDLLVVITDPLLRWSASIYFANSFIFITPVCIVIYFSAVAATVVSVWLTVAFTVDRFVAICCEKLKTKYCTKKTATVVIATVSLLGCLESVPWCFVKEPEYVINNVPWNCVTKQSFHTSPGWAALEMIHYILTPCIPFFLIFVFNVLTVRHISVASKVRRGLRSKSYTDEHNDPEMKSRRKSVILLLSISGSFILLWVLHIAHIIYRRIADMLTYYTYTDPNFTIYRISKMLQVLSTCTNTGIYVVTQSKFREELKNGVKYPFNLIVKHLSTVTQKHL
ncbi:probable G-protein coupled receptor 139 [Stegostoma tigrinum]|uniref:probable G-protein coupled receptor 139 n=1 Tax=Stegostoma tigrinum TaxID=3053191 RepID=UPI00202B3DC9|nr:probable G-protein coupled receptor 139 [Stegostoma tigrinum]